MAPEFPPRLVVFSVEIQGGAVAAQIENIEPPPGAEPLRVRWSDVDQPSGFRAVAFGALYVQDTAGIVFDGPRLVEFDDLGKSRYRWSQGMPPGVPWLMIAMVLPAGYTFRSTRPVPTAAKKFKNSVAVYWILAGDSFGRTEVEWDLQRYSGSLEDEIKLLNSRSSLEDIPTAAGIHLDSGFESKDSLNLRVFLCHSSHDKLQVRSLHQRLRADGFDPWLDEEDLVPGEPWESAIRMAVRSSHIIVVCLSRASITKAGYVQKEIAFALEIADEQPEGAIFIIPLRLEECTVPDRLSRWQWLDYFKEGAHDRLLKALRKRARQLHSN